MTFFKKKSPIRDERIENMQNRLFREVYYLVIAICIVSIAIKTQVSGYDASLLATELVIIVIPAIYYGIRTIWLGIYWDEIELQERTSKLPAALKQVLIGFGAGIVISLFFGIRSALLYGSEATKLYYFFLVSFASFAIYIPFFILVLMIPYLLARARNKMDKSNEKSL